jgi:hypothetical protein
MCVPATVRNLFVPCFVEVTSLSVCETEPVRNANLVRSLARSILKLGKFLVRWNEGAGECVAKILSRAEPGTLVEAKIPIF